MQLSEQIYEKISEKMVKVLTQHGERKYLGKLFEVSQLTVRRALDGQTNTPLARKIRKAAIERGGVVWTGGK